MKRPNPINLELLQNTLESGMKFNQCLKISVIEPHRNTPKGSKDGEYYCIPYVIQPIALGLPKNPNNVSLFLACKVLYCDGYMTVNLTDIPPNDHTYFSGDCVISILDISNVELSQEYCSYENFNNDDRFESYQTIERDNDI